MVFLLKAIGGITALLLLVITLLGSIVTLGGFLLAAIKILIVVIFLAVLSLVVFSILRDRSRRRSETEDI
jgi:membrane protein implicated in regulation of membrane protease activity